MFARLCWQVKKVQTNHVHCMARQLGYLCVRMDSTINVVVGAHCQSFVLELMFNKAKSVKRHQQRSPGTMLDNTTNCIF